MPGRIGHTLVGYSVNSSGFLHSSSSSSSSRNNYLLAFGGQIGQSTISKAKSQQLNDTWLFVSGVANTTELTTAVQDKFVSAHTVRKVLDPYTGKSCFEPTDQSILTNAKECRPCNRWHRIATTSQSRWNVECTRGTHVLGFTAPSWCTSPSTTFLSTGQTSLNRSGHAAVVLSANAQPVQGASNMLMFGGETRGSTGTGETFDNDVWYLSGVNAPTTSSTHLVSGEWRCLETFSQYNPFPGTAPMPSLDACVGEGSTIETLQGGQIGAGTLAPLQACSWVLTNNTAHAIVLDVQVLDLDHALLCRSGMVEIYDGSAETGVLLGRGCSLEAGDSSWDNGQFTAFSGTMTVKLRYEAPCANHDGFQATYSAVMSNSSLACTPTCPNALPCLDVCNNQGHCIHGSCACYDGYHGVNCELLCSVLAPCDTFFNRKTGVSTSGLGFPAPRRSHSAVVVALDTVEVELQRWTDSATATDPIATGVTQCPSIIATNATTKYQPLELSETGIVQTLSSTETTFTFDGVADRTIKRITSKAIVSGYRRSIYFGGDLRRGAGVSNELWTLDVQTPAPVPAAGAGCALTSMHDRLDVQFNAGQCSIATTRCDTFSTSYPHFPRPPLYNQWTKWEPTTGTSTPLARAGHTAVIMQQSNTMVVFGGRGSNGAVLDDVWGLSLSDVSGSNVGAASATAINYATWTKHVPIGHTSVISSTTFDGAFAGTVVHDDSVRLVKDDRVQLTLTSVNSSVGTTLIVPRAQIFEVASETPQFRFISSRSNSGDPTLGYQGTLEIFPCPRSDHAASTMLLDQGETMVVYGGVGAGPKILNDVWLLSFDSENNVPQWKQVQKTYGNFLAASYGEGIFNLVQATTLQRYGADMIPVVSSVNMNENGIHSSSFVKEALLVLGGVNEKKVPDGYNIDYGSRWHSGEYYTGGKEPLLFYLCPDSDV